MCDWRAAPVFGISNPTAQYTIRPSAYCLIEDERRRIALVRTPVGVFLPGGGIEGDETPTEAVVREALEECGLVVRVGPWTTHAVHFVFSPEDRTHYEKRCTFVDATIAGAGSPVELDHELVWMAPETAAASVAHESQAWAITTWLSRVALVLCAVVSLGACATTHHENPALDTYPAGVSGMTDVAYYDVHGRTAAELVAEMRRLGPKSATGGSFFGEARSPMQWNWRTRPDGSMCYATDVRIRVTALITLPRWTPPPDAPPTLVAQWKQFLDGLERHEVGHKDISGRAARDIQQRLGGLRTFCSSFATDARQITDAIVARSRDEQTRYDAATRHGATQGATFPPRPGSALPLPPP